MDKTKYDHLVEILESETGYPVFDDRVLTSKLGYIVLTPLISPDVYVSSQIQGKKVSYQVSIFTDSPMLKKQFVSIKQRLADKQIVCNGESGGFIGSAEYFNYYFTARYYSHDFEL